MTLEQLLQWARKRSLYIMIFADGACEIEYPVDKDGKWTKCDDMYDYIYLTDAVTPKEALEQAHNLLEGEPA